jgi:hypothetical protein
VKGIERGGKRSENKVIETEESPFMKYNLSCNFRHLFRGISMWLDPVAARVNPFLANAFDSSHREINAGSHAPQPCDPANWNSRAG